MDLCQVDDELRKGDSNHLEGAMLYALCAQNLQQAVLYRFFFGKSCGLTQSLFMFLVSFGLGCCFCPAWRERQDEWHDERPPPFGCRLPPLPVLRISATNDADAQLAP